MAVFFPWAQINEYSEVGDWQLIPVDVNELKPEELICQRLFKSYKVNPSLEISGLTIFKHKNKDQFESLNDDEMMDVIAISEIISFASLTEREFFSHHPYTNSSAHAIVLQKFTDKSKFVVIDARRRDGVSSNVIPDEINLVLKPHHVPSNSFTFDKHLAHSLVECRESTHWPRFHETIFSYLKANTDDNAVQIHSELMFALGAFERVLNINNGRCDDLAISFRDILAKVLREENKSSDGGRDLKKLCKYDSLREIWIRDFCSCRGDMAHGRRKQSYPSIWRAEEHLLLASEILPVLIKIELSKLSLYSMTDEDKRRIYYFDQRLRQASLFKIGENHQAPIFGWSAARSKAVWEWNIKKKDLIVT